MVIMINGYCDKYDNDDNDGKSKNSENYNDGDEMMIMIKW